MENKQIFIEMAQVKLPSFKETRVQNQDWIKYGDDNLFPISLQDMLNRSALHNAIVSSKVDYSCGKGLTYEKNKDKKTDLFLDFVNANESMKTVFRKLVFDYIVYGGYAINVILSRDKKNIAEIYHIDFAKLRSGKKNTDRIVEQYYFSNDWANYRKAENYPTKIPAYNPKSKESSQLIYINEYRPGCEYYPLPSYVAAIAYIETDAEIANFHLANIKNGMNPSLMITLMNGEPTEEDKQVVKAQFDRKYTGTDNAGKIIVNFANSKDTAPVIQTMSPSAMDRQFIQLQSTVLQNILSGHKVVSPMLVGIKTEGQLGGANELDTAYNIYYKTIIEPIQSNVLETINRIMNINGMQELQVIPADVISFSWSEAILKEIMSVNELREKVGLEPIEETNIEETPTATEQQPENKI